MERFWACNGVMMVIMNQEMVALLYVTLKEAGHVEVGMLLHQTHALRYVGMELTYTFTHVTMVIQSVEMDAAQLARLKQAIVVWEEIIIKLMCVLRYAGME